jgi:hypothetical protein
MKLVSDLFSENVTISNLEISDVRKFQVSASLASGVSMSEIEICK